MKVGIVLKNYSPDIGGGYEYQDSIVNGLISSSASSGHEFIFFFEGSVPSRFSHVNTRVKTISIYPSNKFLHKFVRIFDYIADKINDFGFPQFYKKRLESTAEREGIELLFFPQPEHMPVSIPYITTVWDLQHRLKPWFPELIGNGEWERRERITARRISRAYRIMTGTEEGKKQICSLYSIPMERVVVNPFPVIPDDSTRMSNDEIDSVINSYGISSPFYLYPAQFWAHKNHIILIDALRLLKEKYRYSPVFVFVGSDKGNLKYIQDMIEKNGLLKNIIIPGFIPRKHLSALYERAEALVYPSWFGPDNLPPIEAIIAGCPVIASTSSGAYNQLGEGCLLFDPINPNDLAENIMLLVHDTLRREQIVFKGKERAFSWTLNDYYDLLISVIDEFEPIKRCWIL